MPASIALKASVAKLVSFAMHQASVPVVGELVVRNDGDDTIDALTVELSCEPAVIAPRRWVIDRVRAQTVVSPADRTVTLDGGMLYKLTERIRANITIRLLRGAEVLDSYATEIVALARHEWGGSISTPELLAAFVTPNDPGVSEILRDASDKLREHGREPSLEGYQSRSKDRVWEIASAIWSAVVARRLIYAEPPASFESHGQRIRLPSEVLGQRLATCLDTAVLFAAALEQAGLRPLLALTRGHALTGVWLQPATLLGVTTQDPSDLRTYIALGELVLFETTVVCTEPPATFTQALQLGAQQIRPELDDDFVLALDVRQARARQILPVPAELEHPAHGDQTRFVSPPLDTPPALGGFSPVDGPDLPDTPQGRLDAWKRRLLDLTKRNRLLNLKPSKTAIRLVCADAGRLEDILAKGEKLTIVPLETLASRGGGRDAATLMVQRKVDFERELAHAALEENRIPARLDADSLKAGIIELFRKAKSDLEEGGANTLFLAIGILRWRDSEAATTWHLAPLLLVPVRLERATAANDPKLMAHTDDTVFNMTLLEMLRQDFELRLPQLEGELPADANGVDVLQVMTIVRQAIRDVPGWEVLDDVVLSSFFFAKYLMWKDLNDHTDELRTSRFVAHMIDTPRERYSRQPEFIAARDHDARIDPSRLLTPLPCDSSQVAAIYASGHDGDFVLEGPPGTGKSQTIANLIAHNLGLGRTVLFVAEKVTALNVVQDRLRKVGLGDFCLELHSSKANKRDVLAQLDRAWSRQSPEAGTFWETESARLAGIRSELNALVSALHAPGPTGLSPREAIALATVSEFSPAIQLDWPADPTADRAGNPSGLRDLKTLSRELGQAFRELTPADLEEFASLQHSDWSFQWLSQITAAASALVPAIDEADATAGQFLDQTRLPGATDLLSDLSRLADFARAIPVAASMDLQAVLAPDGVETADRLQRATELLAGFRNAVEKLSAGYEPERITRAGVEGLKNAWADANRKLWPLSLLARKRTVKAAMRQFGAAQPIDIEADLPVLEGLVRQRAEFDRLTAGLPATALWRGLDTDIPKVEALIRLGESARLATTRLAQNPSDLSELLQRIRTLLVDGRDLLQPGMPVAKTAAKLVDAVGVLASALHGFRELAKVADGEAMTLGQIRALALAITSRAPRLNAWCRWQERRERSRSTGLASLVTGLEHGLILPTETTAAFEVAYARWVAPLLIDARDELRRFQSVEHGHLIEQFRKLDGDLAKLATETIRARASALLPGKSDADLTPGFSMLRREVQRRTGNAPVRKLISEMGSALTRLTPCVLMSPHSVAQFLSAGAIKFDLVVFDEASQIAVWDAIGAIARGRNAIIVGDPKQMPPTNFFNRGANAEEIADADVGSTELGDLESILDEGLATGMYHHRLTGHYRSQHESLIAFSNHKYYNGDLVTYPASATAQSMVTFRRVNGAYQMGNGRTNPAEAKAVVAEIVKRLTDPNRRDQTIGVVTMNTEQQRLIRNLLDDERRRSPALEAAFKDGAGDEVEMVYNLETVQGHERDVIMLSVGYGPKVAGDRAMSMNFGPLNRAGGERRLNVAVTRAIREVVVFASFDPDMIDITRTQARAVHDLKAYLDFASRGPVALAREASVNTGRDDFDSVFEERVAAQLRARGWTVQTQVGVSRFRIDLGIVHPDRPGRFLAGIECDGATYHSSPTARDRDRVRHSILTSLGWRLVRLWSTDYFMDSERALERVHLALEDLLNTDRSEAAPDGGPDTPNGDLDTPAAAADLAELEDYSADLPDIVDAAPEGAVVPAADEGTLEPDIEAGSLGVPLVPAGGAGESLGIRPAGDASRRQFAAQFYDQAYLTQLRPLCLEIIDRVGPITFAHLAERVARAHGFQRTGSEIKKRVWSAVGRQRKATRAPDGTSTLWPLGQEPLALVAYRGTVVEGELRPWAFVPYVERIGLALDVVRTTPAELRLAELAKRLGVGRLRARTRDELVELLESAASMRGD